MNFHFSERFVLARHLHRARSDDNDDDTIFYTKQSIAAGNRIYTCQDANIVKVHDNADTIDTSKLMRENRKPRLN